MSGLQLAHVDAVSQLESKGLSSNQAEEPIREASYVANAIGLASWSSIFAEDSSVIILPGAWAMGDGLILETGAHRKPTVKRSKSKSWGGSMPNQQTDSIGSRVLRMASSFSSSVSGYFSEFAGRSESSCVDSDSPCSSRHDSFDAASTGEIQWTSGASSLMVSSSKKDD